MEQQKPEATAVADIVEKYREAKTIELEDPEGMTVPAMLLPQGIRVESVKKLFDEYRTAPERRRGTATFEDLDSFIAHVQRFKDADSLLFARREPPSLTSVLNYHRAKPDGDPRFGDHRGLYQFPFSDEWQAWTEKNGEQMSQQDFAEFVEERIPDILDPSTPSTMAKDLAEAAELTYASPSRMLALSRGITVRQGVRVKNVTSLQSGEMAVHYETQNSDETGAPLAIPNAFLVGIPVFRNGARYVIAVRLRYRVGAGSMLWFYDLYQHDKVFDDAFGGACERAETETELPLYFGSPEQ